MWNFRFRKKPQRTLLRELTSPELTSGFLLLAIPSSFTHSAEGKYTQRLGSRCLQLSVGLHCWLELTDTLCSQSPAFTSRRLNIFISFGVCVRARACVMWVGMPMPDCGWGPEDHLLELVFPSTMGLWDQSEVIRLM